MRLKKTNYNLINFFFLVKFYLNDELLRVIFTNDELKKKNLLFEKSLASVQSHRNLLS